MKYKRDEVMGYYKFRKKDLVKELESIPDDDFIMINLGGHTSLDYPITCVEDSTSVGFWELRCDSSINFWDALEKDCKNNDTNITGRQTISSVEVPC